MDWQQITSLCIVALSAVLLVRGSLVKKKRSGSAACGSCDTCGTCGTKDHP